MADYSLILNVTGASVEAMVVPADSSVCNNESVLNGRMITIAKQPAKETLQPEGMNAVVNMALSELGVDRSQINDFKIIVPGRTTDGNKFFREDMFNREEVLLGNAYKDVLKAETVTLVNNAVALALGFDHLNPVQLPALVLKFDVGVAACELSKKDGHTVGKELRFSEFPEGVDFSELYDAVKDSVPNGQTLNRGTQIHGIFTKCLETTSSNATEATQTLFSTLASAFKLSLGDYTKIVGGRFAEKIKGDFISMNDTLEGRNLSKVSMLGAVVS